MRIILLAATLLGAAAMATAAAARPGGSGAGHGGGLQTGWSNGGGHHGGKGVRTRFGTGSIRGDGHGRHHRRHGRWDGQDFNPYGGVGIVGPVGAVDPHGTGFFTGGGGEIRLRGGRPYFEYDRAYPYEFASVAGGRRQWVVEEERPSAPAERCTFENGVRVCRGW